MSRTSVIQLRQSGSIFMPAFSQFYGKIAVFLATFSGKWGKGWRLGEKTIDTLKLLKPKVSKVLSA